MSDILVALPLILIWLSAAVRTATHGSPQDRAVAWLGLGLSFVLAGLLALA
jgi:hypothetical protein